MSTTTLKADRPKLHLDIVIFHNGTRWVGQCAQLDIVTSDPDAERVFAMAQKLCAAQVIYAADNDRWDGLFHPPTKEIMEIMKRAQQAGEFEVKLSTTVEDGSMPYSHLAFQKVVAAPLAA